MEVKSIKEVDEEAKAEFEIWDIVFAFTPMAVVKCAIELGIADVLESHGGAMSLPELSSALNCSSSLLHRIMRYLIHRGFFKRNQEPPFSYVQTPLSRLIMKNEGSGSMAALVMLESSPVMLAPWHRLTSRLLINNGTPPFEAAHGDQDIWEYASENSAHSDLINDAMACHARRAIAAIVDQYPEAFKGIGSLVDVGGGNGTALRAIVKACPWIRGINLDLPHVVSKAPQCDGVEHVEGDMFKYVPKGDATFLMWTLHDWSDDECIKILKNCREAIPRETGKVIIAEAVITEGDEDRYSNARFDLDMVMLAHTEKGKERTVEEWEYVVKQAGFTTYTVKHIGGEVVSIIQAYP